MVWQSTSYFSSTSVTHLSRSLQSVPSWSHSWFSIAEIWPASRRGVPSFSPPNWVFAPVWTLLYALMGVAAYLVWSRGRERKGVRVSLIVFGFQLGLNLLWSVLFFGLRSPSCALIEILFLWAMIILTITRFWKISKPAGLLLVPYLLWVSFAALLNGAVFWLNQWEFGTYLQINFAASICWESIGSSTPCGLLWLRKKRVFLNIRRLFVGKEN